MLKDKLFFNKFRILVRRPLCLQSENGKGTSDLFWKTGRKRLGYTGGKRDVCAVRVRWFARARARSFKGCLRMGGGV